MAEPIFSTSEFVIHCAPATAVSGLLACSQTYAASAIQVELPDCVGSGNICVTADVWVYSNNMPLVYMCSRCEPYPALRVKFFTHGTICVCIVRRKTCACIPIEFSLFIDRYWRTYVGWLYDQRYITVSGHLAVSTCVSDNDGWQTVLTPRDRVIVDIQQRYASRRLPLNNGLIADELATAGFFNLSTGENYHDDTVKRLRWKLNHTLRLAGYPDRVWNTRNLKRDP